jgi:hypothetical protein
MPATYYEVHDLYFAAFCIANGVKLQQVYRRPDNWTIFCFNEDEMPRVQSAWQNMRSQVTAHEFVAAEKYLRGLMRA